jgi:hypothetical protein
MSAQDRREFIRVCVDLPLNPKLAGLDDPAAGWLYVTSMCYCGRELTDGVFPLTIVLRLAGVEKDRAEALVKVGMWHEPGHDCPRCPQPEMGSMVVHDYLMHQRSKAEAEATRASKSAAGAKGAAKRWGNRGDTSPIAGAIADEWHGDSKTMPEVEVEKELTTPPNPPRRGGNRGKVRDTSEFQAFWDGYGHKKAIAAAERAWSKALARPGVTADQLTAAAIAYRSDLQAKGKWPEYAAHPATWLNRERYLDAEDTPASVSTLPPREHLKELWRSGDALTVSRLVGKPWVEPSQPPSDRTPRAEWLRDARRAFIEEHHTAALTALAARATRRAS